ncbi:zinc ABC transporter substrate-binding protein ZnuA [Shigella flexneri]
MLPDGASEHDYSLRPSDVKRLQGADLVVWIGPEMEAFMEKSVKNIPNAKQVTIAQLNDVKPLLMKGADDDDDDHDHWLEKSDEHHHHGDYNMHLRLSPEIARASAVAIHEKLVELMPQSRAKLDANLKDFEAQLAATDKQVGNESHRSREKVIRFHDAYGYYEKHYGLTPLGHFTVNPEIQPGASVYMK